MAARKLKMQEKSKKLSDALEEVQGQTQATEDIHALVDAGYDLNEIKKTCETLLKDIKDQVMAHAKENQVKQVKGQSGRTLAKISQKSSTVYDPKGVLGVLKKMGRLDMFSTVFTVSVTNFKKYFGENPDIAETNTEEYGSISFQEKKR